MKKNEDKNKNKIFEIYNICGFISIMARRGGVVICVSEYKYSKGELYVLLFGAWRTKLTLLIN